MADANLATKAPENDAAADGVAAGSSASPPMTSGAPMGEHCVSDRPTPIGHSGTGELRKLGDVEVYVSKPSDYPHAPARLLLLLSSGTGHKSTNNQVQADKFASEGFVVVMPDLFDGDAFPKSSTAIVDGDAAAGQVSIIEQVKLKAVEAAKSFMIDMWLARHTEDKVLPILRRVVDACADEFADAVSNGGGIYAAGYCFGGRYVILLAGDRHRPRDAAARPQRPADEESGPPTAVMPLIKVGAVAHPSMVSLEDFASVSVPLSLVCVENDPMFPDEVRTALEDSLSKANVEHEVQVYPDVPHGFAVVGEYSDATIKAAQETAWEQMLKWLVEH